MGYGCYSFIKRKGNQPKTGMNAASTEKVGVAEGRSIGCVYTPLGLRSAVDIMHRQKNMQLHFQFSLAIESEAHFLFDSPSVEGKITSTYFLDLFGWLNNCTSFFLSKPKSLLWFTNYKFDSPGKNLYPCGSNPDSSPVNRQIAFNFHVGE